MNIRCYDVVASIYSNNPKILFSPEQIRDKVNIICDKLEIPRFGDPGRTARQMVAENSIFRVGEQGATEYDPKHSSGFQHFINVFPMLKTKERKMQTENFLADFPLQRITYGAPGTGKSHGIEDVVGKYADTVRTTFHPDSDYSTFVGCYKPTMEKKPRYGQQGLPIRVNGAELTEDVISYSYVPQAFTKAYVRAWKKLSADGKSDGEKRQFLVIEEINRGNCAQIFGDLFQLLDRKGDGFSKYPIEADTDLARYIESELLKLDADAQNRIPPEVLSGKKLMLPPNLYIWATMNTSDQSLFPMDSAFKRRWDWEYCPIKDAEKGWKIVADGAEFPWWDFLVKINKCIYDALKNEDRQLGYFFAKPDGDASNVIPASKFVSKVLFYLYSDVFKDYDLPRGFAKTGGGRFAFADFFLDNGKIDETKVKELLSNLLRKEPQEDEAGA